MTTNNSVTVAPPQPFEDSLFSYELVREVGVDLEFRNVTLKVPVGEFPVGTKFYGAFLSTAGVVAFRHSDYGEVFTYRLSVSVGERITEDDLKSFANDCKCGGTGCGNPKPACKPMLH